ncbi:Bug family tripartite tricarboxylate transporter substrate binding protein [Muricoccus radiodurans]|uniref:Bug family tripartite tricarboxylate transporter substrate binding protein n=1 Tax=Muricoccus radiodurans TaxID=2231721 RepID=UPI003CF45EA8
MITRRTGMAALAGLPLLAPRAGRAQERYPDRPPRIVVPYAAGTATDLFARLLSGAMGDALGQRPVVENRVGAGGIVGAELVARATPDGYTMLLAGSQTHATNISLYPRLPYDPIRDFAPIARLATQPMVLVAHPDLPVRNVQELVALAKARPGQMNYASSGIGTTAHLCGATLRTQAGVDIVHVPYASGGQLFTELLSGATSFMFYPYQPLQPHVEAGKLRVLATTGPTRPGFLPNAPTMVESGFPDFVITVWFAAYAPAGTPPARVSALSDAFRRALDTREVQAALTTAGTEAFYANPADTAAFTAAEIERYRKIVADSGARVE